jgi:hypothetical protein
LNQQEQKRLYVLNQVIGGKLIARKAADLLKRSVRQVRHDDRQQKESGNPHADFGSFFSQLMRDSSWTVLPRPYFARVTKSLDN